MDVATNAISPTVDELTASFQRTLAALNRTAPTRRTYGAALTMFVRFLAEKGMPQAVASIRREHVEAFMGDLLHERTGKTAITYYAALKVFFAWCEEEGEIIDMPMRKMKPPTIPDRLAPVLTDDAMRRLLKVCDGRDFLSRRDTAIIRLFIDTGMRMAELVGITLESLKLDSGSAEVFGKGRHWRVCPFGAKTAQAIDRYLRLRKKHQWTASPALWLGAQGALKDKGVQFMLMRRGEQADIPGLHAHLFRHYFAHTFLSAGGQENDLMKLAGWRSHAMLGHYAASAAAGRAQEAHRRLGLGDRF